MKYSSSISLLVLVCGLACSVHGKIEAATKSDYKLPQRVCEAYEDPDDNDCYLDDLPDISDRSDYDDETPVDKAGMYTSPTKLSKIKITTTATTLDKYKARLRDLERARMTSGMDDVTIDRLRPLNCKQSSAYRTPDGSCNNIRYGCWGRAGETYNRALPAEYGDGKEKPRISKYGHTLPNVRVLSRVMQGKQIQSAKTCSKFFSDMTTHFGQFLAHELSSAAPYADKEVKDGKVVQVTPKCCHVKNPDDECNPIPVEDGDDFYEHNHCIELVRSQPYNSSETSCPKNNGGSPDIREQVNAVTAFLDGSLIYGNNRQKLEQLVDEDGSMLMDENGGYVPGGLMPRSDDEGQCHTFYPGCDKRCFKAGDVRASLTPILGALQTMFLRQHNAIAKHFIERKWSKWEVFNVTRKIIAAQMQVVTYKEYLPLMLGKQTMNRFNLSVPTSYYQYQSYLNPSILNTWATAACRVSHSNIADKLKREIRTYERCPVLSYDLNNMDEFCKPDVDPIRNFLVGAVQQKMQDLNTIFSKEVTNFLFSEKPLKPGKDLRAIDYHRARDHGVPSYNSFRKWCGLKPYSSFDEMKKSCSNQYNPLIDELKTLYYNEINDLDFGIGAILEPIEHGSTFGPTVTCLFGHQFHNLKYGDRFWYENRRIPSAFTTVQLEALNKVTLSGLICATTDIQRIQQNAFFVPSEKNPVVSCQHILANQDLKLHTYTY